MEQQSSPDLTIDVCPKCEGIFLDKKELNALATGVAGDIEYMTADDVDNDDRFPNRNCPSCSDVTMRKMELLGYSGIVFDYCESCNGFFLDKGELDSMNRELARHSKRKLAEEFRGEIDGYLIRKDRTNVTVMRAEGPIEYLQNGFNVRVSAYFKQPIAAGLRLTSETVGDKLTKLLKIQKKQDIEVGNPEPDGKLTIQADMPEEAKKVLSQEVVANAILSYLFYKPKMFTFATKFEMLDDCISCIGGPYAERLNYR
jgi:Zn-finger nucleic acid-binding protein